MSQEQLPDYDPVEQGLDSDRDQRVPASLERRVSLDKMPSAHRILATQLNESGGTFTGGLAVAAVAGTGKPAAQVRVVIYVRVSTEEQAKVGGLVEGFSIPYQRDACMAEAEKRGCYVVEVYVDAGESARSSRRPKLQKMLKELKKLKVDFVMVHKIDRLARNRSDDVEINNAIAAAGAKLLSVSEPVDDTPAGKFHYNVMADVAQYHSDNLAVEVMKGLETKARSGGTPYRPPLGYLNYKEVVDGDIIVRKVKIDEERGPLIRWALNEYATGNWTLLRLCEALTEKGLLTRPGKKTPGKELQASVLQNMLHNPYYAGIVPYNGVYHQGTHEPLITVETWLRIQDVLAAHNLAGEKDRKHPHYLKGTVFCSECGGRLIFSRNKGHGGTYDYFFCLNRRTHRATCTRGGVRVRVVEEAVEDFYGTFQLTERDVEQLREAVKLEIQSERAHAEEDQARARRQLSKLRDQQAKVLQAHYAGAVPLDLMKVEMDRLARGLADADRELAISTTALDELDAHLEQALKVTQSCQREYLAAAPAIRRQINQGLFVKLFIGSDGSVEHAELNEPFASLMARHRVPSGRSERSLAIPGRRRRPGDPNRRAHATEPPPDLNDREAV